MRTLRFILSEYRANLRWLVIGLSALFLGTLCQAAIPIFIKLAVDAAAPGGFVRGEGLSGWLTDVFMPFKPDDKGDFVLVALGTAALVAVVMGVFTFLKRYYLVRISRRTEYSVKKTLYGKLQNLPASYYNNTRSGAIQSLLTSDIENVRMMIGPAVMYLCGTVIMFPAALAVMLSLNVTLTLLAMAPLAGLTASTLWFNPRVRRYTTKGQEDLAELSARAQENFAGARVVKAFSREQFEVQQLEAVGRRYLHNKLGASRNQSMFQASIWGFSGLGVLIILYVGALEISRGALTTGDLAAFMMYNLNLYWPMIALGWVMMLFTRAEASLKRLNELADQPADAGRAGTGIMPDKLSGEVEFSNVGHRYLADGPMVLADINFRVAPGRTLAVVGPVGCGKSTLANLLVRLFDTTTGQVLIDGRPIQHYNANALRRHIGYVPQDSFLFSDTIANNIALGLSPEDPGRDTVVRRSAQAAEFEPEVQAFPAGYDTMLGERGVNLSGGQKQRAAIARALALSPAILVLDDCLSAVDTDTEERILRNLKQLGSSLTTVIIAQRISAVQHADEILVLDAGRIVERGTDAELRRKGGLYCDLARRQELAAELA